MKYPIDIIQDLINHDPTKVRTFFDQLKDDEYPNGAWMTGIPGEDHYLGNTPEESEALWDAAQIKK